LTAVGSGRSIVLVPTAATGRGRITAALLLLVLCFAVAGSTATRTDAAPAGRLQLGILGNAGRFTQLTGQKSSVRHVFASLYQAGAFPRILEQLRPVPMLALKPGGTPPLDIAQGKADTYLVTLNGALANFGGLVYVRPMPEMNGHWNEYCAFERDGSSRGPRYSTASFRKAFARIAIFARGGPEGQVNAQLRKLGLPGVTSDLSKTQARIVWNPQGYGAPDIPANSAAAYYPGDRYVDVVANDLYRQSTGVAWEANDRLYAAHRNKPFAIAEWGLWGMDDPTYVQQMATFAKTHPRMEFLSYFNSKPGSLWDLGSKPRSRDAYRRLITPLGG
jgi:hypothetical protein